jgi:hypothetical protein
VPIGALRDNWVDGVDVVYIGKANNLQRRLQQYERFGSGKPAAQLGGKLIWQLPDSHTMRVAWRTTLDDNPRDVEQGMIGLVLAISGCGATLAFSPPRLSDAVIVDQSRMRLIVFIGTGE